MIFPSNLPSRIPRIYAFKDQNLDIRFSFPDGYDVSGITAKAFYKDKYHNGLISIATSGQLVTATITKEDFLTVNLPVFDIYIYRNSISILGATIEISNKSGTPNLQTFDVTIVDGFVVNVDVTDANASIEAAERAETAAENAEAIVPALQADIDLKIPLAQKGVVNGVATYEQLEIKVSRFTSINQATLQSVITSIGSNPCTIILDRSIAITSNMTIPDNIKIDFIPGAVFDISVGVVLTILSTIKEGNQRLFQGLGDVDLNVPEVNAYWFGAAPGAANNYDAFVKSTRQGLKVYIPAGTYAMTGVLSLPGNEFYGSGSKTIISMGSGSGSKIQPQSNTKIHDIAFTGTPTHYIAIEGATSKTNVWVYYCYGTSGNIGIYIDRGTNVTSSNLKIFNNSFTSMASHSILSVRVNDSLFWNNTCRGTSARNIEFFGGKRNTITENIIDSGITGISFTCQYSTAQAFGQPEGNLIEKNIITNVKEESISFDIRGNDPANMATREQSTVASKSQGAGPTYFINLDNSVLFNASKPWIGLHLCFLSGGYKANTVEILDYAIDGATTRFNVRLTLEQYNLISVSDQVIVGSPFTRNKIALNNIVMPEKSVGAIHPPTGIYLYGLCYYNIVFTNTIRSLSATQDAVGIRVTSLAGLDSTGSLITLPVGRKAPCENNILDGNILINCDESIDYSSYNDGAPYNSLGNKHVNAKVQGRIIVDRNQDLVSNCEALLGITYTNSLPNPIEGKISVIANGNGTQTINIPHNLGYTPSYVVANAKNIDSKGIDFSEANSTDFIIHHSANTAVAIGNLSYYIEYKK